MGVSYKWHIQSLQSDVAVRNTVSVVQLRNTSNHGWNEISRRQREVGMHTNGSNLMVIVTVLR